MVLLRRWSCQTKSLLSCANRIPFIHTRKGCVIPSFSVDRLSLTHAIWCKSNMNSYDECGWMALPSHRPRLCLPFPSDLLRSPNRLGTSGHRGLAPTANRASSCPQAHRGAHHATTPPGQDDVCSPISTVVTGAVSPEGASTQY